MVDIVGIELRGSEEWENERKGRKDRLSPSFHALALFPRFSFSSQAAAFRPVDQIIVSWGWVAALAKVSHKCLDTL